MYKSIKLLGAAAFFVISLSALAAQEYDPRQGIPQRSYLFAFFDPILIEEGYVEGYRDGNTITNEVEALFEARKAQIFSTTTAAARSIQGIPNLSANNWRPQREDYEDWYLYAYYTGWKDRRGGRASRATTIAAETKKTLNELDAKRAEASAKERTAREKAEALEAFTTHFVTEAVRLRKTPSIQGEVITTLKEKQPVQLIETGPYDEVDGITAKWMHVKTQNGETGWCFGGYLADKSASKPPPERYYP